MGSTAIEDLPLRFAAIATEVGTGHEIWLTRGSLSLAMRASYALPGIFPPVKLGGRWLMDGALVNPVPVTAARAFGARVVIAVNLDADRFARGATIASHGSDPSDEPPVPPPGTPRRAFMGLRGMFGAERALRREMFADDGRPGFSTVMVEAFNIMQDRLTRMRLAGDPPDVHITPHIGISAGSDSIARQRRLQPARLRPKKRSSRSWKRSPRSVRAVTGGKKALLRRRLQRTVRLAGEVDRTAIQQARGGSLCIGNGRWSAAGRAARGGWRCHHDTSGSAVCHLRVAVHHAVGDGLELWASRIFSCAPAPCPSAALITATAQMNAMLRIPPPRLESS